MLFFNDVSNSTFTRLAIDADEVFKFAANISGINMQIRNFPTTKGFHEFIFAQSGLVDGVLV